MCAIKLLLYLALGAARRSLRESTGNGERGDARTGLERQGTGRLTTNIERVKPERRGELASKRGEESTIFEDIRREIFHDRCDKLIDVDLASAKNGYVKFTSK